MNPLANQQKLAGITLSQLLYALLSYSMLNKNNISTKGECLFIGLTLPFVGSKEIGQYYYCLDLAFSSSTLDQMKQFRGEVPIPDGNMGIRELVEAVQIQVISNQYYLELKHLSDKNKYTKKCRKKKIGGKLFIISLGA